ncbi:MAG: alpha/beta fold hydrolase [Nitrososphaeraceae archaeon]
MNKQISNQKMHSTSTLHRTVTVDGLSVFYREAGDPSNPKMVLLHGFPSSSHQYRHLILALADHFHVVAPDYPGFGNSDLPNPNEFNYTFDRLSEVTEDFLKTIGFTHFGLYMQDYGGPVGFRIITRHPEWFEWLIIQNANAYEVGFTRAWDGLRNALWKYRTSEAEEPLYGFLQLETIRQAYLYGNKNPEAISPDNWNMDFRFMERPNARRVQMDLFYDYRTNVALYPKWQKFLQERQPKSLIFWGQNDIFFTREGGEAYLKDLPHAEMHRLDSGHFAMEDCLEEIASNIHRFYRGRVKELT